VTRARLAAIIVAATCAARPLGAAEEISIVGSSTLYPFVRHAVDKYTAASGERVSIESTGTEAGFDFFCAGTAPFLPDINNASVTMTLGQWRTCRRNGVRDIAAFLVGYDGLVVFSADGAPLTGLSLDHLYDAMADEIPVDGTFVKNTRKLWSEINPALPALPIRIMGPPHTSGTRLYIEDEVLGKICLRRLGRLERGASLDTERRCKTIRDDGAYVDISEDDQLLIRLVQGTEGGVGLVGYGQFHLSKVGGRVLRIDGVEPTFANIEQGAYPLSRPLFIYVKMSRLKREPALGQFLSLLLGDEMTGAHGALTAMGLVPPSELIIRQNRDALAEQTEIKCPSQFCGQQLED
jgi:phosphate transport system substrate-binding protein